MGPGAQKIASCLLFLLGVLLVIVPGICSWTWSFPRDSAEQRLAWGSVLGIGAAVYLANVCAFGQLSWFYPLWAGLLILSVGSFALRPGKLRVSLWNPSEGAAGSATHASSAPANIPETEANVHPALSTLHEADWSSKLAASPKRVLVLLLLLIALVEIASVRRQVVPPGFDPSFHLLLAKKIALTNHIIRDWQPFENATLNYPLGSHYLIVLFGGFCGLPLPRVFQLLMVTLSLLSALAV